MLLHGWDLCSWGTLESKVFSVICKFLRTFLQHVYSMERDNVVLSKLNFLSFFVHLL